MSGNYRKEKNCLNCGHHVEAHYCSHCGQPNLELKEPFWAFIGHSVGHYFHFDSKFLHTLIPLMTKPGQVTLDYLAGKRARYIHPVSLYIFVSIVYFLTVHALEKPDHSDPVKQEQVNHQKLDSTLNAVQINENRLGHDLEKQTKELIKGSISKSEFRKLPRPFQLQYIDSLKKINAAKPTDSLKKVIDKFKHIASQNNDTTYTAYLQHQKTLSAKEQDGWIARKTLQYIYSLQEKKKDDTLNIQEEIKKYEPKQYFLLMPLMAFFIMLNFRKNKIYYIDHLVFTIHGMTAFFIISIVTLPLKIYVFGESSVVSLLISILVVVGTFWYMYKGLKLFYNRSRRLTIRKTITVSILYALSFALSAWLIKQIIIHIIH